MKGRSGCLGWKLCVGALSQEGCVLDEGKEERERSRQAKEGVGRGERG